ncbi:HD domain-containing protein [Candidatus Saccharibacteria bacterium]|nr:MAG: HD domain-containing protein [Candidatus Saccharibacteria bacterium]
MKYPSLDDIAKIQQLIANFSTVERAPKIGGLERRENDVDHSFGLAMTCWYLHSKIAPELDLLEVIKYALTHDMVELYAGDTFAFDEEGMKSKREREKHSVRQLAAIYDDFPEIATYADGYMERISEEARFVKAVDKLLPPIMIELGGGEEWRRLGITLAMEKENKVSLRVSSQIAPYYELLLQWLDERGNIPKDSGE